MRSVLACLEAVSGGKKCEQNVRFGHNVTLGKLSEH